MPIAYITDLDEVRSIHASTIEISGGGISGEINLGYLESALQQIQNDDYYPCFIDKLTHLVFAANKSHCFQDGNKRISISLGALFLLKNGYLTSVQRFLHKMEVVSYHLAAGNIDKDFLHELLESIVYEDDFSEEIKIKLLNSISTGANDLE